MNKFLALVVLLLYNTMCAQNIDSLRQALLFETSDSNKVILLVQLGNLTTDTVEASRSLNEAIELAKATRNVRGLAMAYKAAGINAFDYSHFAQASFWYTASLREWTTLGDNKEMAKCYYMLGVLDAQFKNDAHAITNLQKAARLNIAIDNQYALGQNYVQLSQCFQRRKQFDSTLYYLRKSEEISRKLDQFHLVIYTTMADVFLEMNMLDSSMIYLDIADSMVALTQGVEYGRAWNDLLRGKVYMSQQKLQEARGILEKTYEFAINKDDGQLLFEVIPQLLKCYHLTGDDKKGFALQEKWDKLQDSLRNSEMADQALGMQIQFEAIQLAQADSLQQIARDVRANAELEREQMYRNISLIVVGLMALVALFIYRGLRQKKRSNVEIFNQKKLVEEKQKEIVDSITYAKRLQDAILPPASLIKQTLPDSFVLYLPKDIVAGDFYWMEVVSDDVFFAAADCTGHGVPGAMVSVVCSNALNRTVKELGLSSTGDILDKVRELVIQTFEKSESDVMDGMDISLAKISVKKNSLEWSGANNPLWIISENKLIEIKADKQPIGKYDKSVPFTSHKLDLTSGMIVYLFTDGYADQFGGDKGKKFRYKQMEELLLRISPKPMSEQKEILSRTITEWRGGLEQVDDICIAGFKI